MTYLKISHISLKNPPTCAVYVRRVWIVAHVAVGKLQSTWAADTVQIGTRRNDWHQLVGYILYFTTSVELHRVVLVVLVGSRLDATQLVG